MESVQVRSIASLRRGLQVLSLVEAQPGLVLHELHACSGIPKASLLRILKTLIEQSLVSRRTGDAAYLPVQTQPAKSKVKQVNPALPSTIPSLQDLLSERLPWPSDLAVPIGLKMRVVDSNRAAYGRLWRPSVLGEEVDMLDSAMGRAYLAFTQAEACRVMVDEVLTGSHAKTRRREAIEREIAETRRRGFGLRDDMYAGPDTHHGRQLSAIAVPVMQGAGVIACISCVWDTRTTSQTEVLQSGLAHLVRSASKCLAPPV